MKFIIFSLIGSLTSSCLGENLVETVIRHPSDNGIQRITSDPGIQRIASDNGIQRITSDVIQKIKSKFVDSPSDAFQVMNENIISDTSSIPGGPDGPGDDGNRVDPRLDIYWITSGNNPLDDKPNLEEYRMIQYFRNTHILNKMDLWAWSLNARWHWWMYGETTVSPCYIDLGTFEDFISFKKYMNSSKIDLEISPNLNLRGKNHVGFDTISYAMKQSDELFKNEFDIRYVIWENRILEPLGTPPTPQDIDMNLICNGDDTNVGHIHPLQFQSSFHTLNHRLFVLNYHSLDMIETYKQYLSYTAPNLMFNVNGIPINQDPHDNFAYASQYAPKVANALWLFLARGPVNNHQPHIDQLNL